MTFKTGYGITCSRLHAKQDRTQHSCIDTKSDPKNDTANNKPTLKSDSTKPDNASNMTGPDWAKTQNRRTGKSNLWLETGFKSLIHFDTGPPALYQSASNFQTSEPRQTSLKPASNRLQTGPDLTQNFAKLPQNSQITRNHTPGNQIQYTPNMHKEFTDTK